MFNFVTRSWFYGNCLVFLSFRLGGYEQLPDLRHTFATHALASGVDAKTLSGILGHTNASFTLDTYTHVTPDMQRAASDVVGGFLENLLGEELRPWQENAKTEPAP